MIGPYAVYRVSGPSMMPTWQPGDILLARRVKQNEYVPPGTVVIARFPLGPKCLVIKRVVRTRWTGDVVLTSDNPDCKSDISGFGPAFPVARVVRRIWR